MGPVVGNPGVGGGIGIVGVNDGRPPPPPHTSLLHMAGKSEQQNEDLNRI